LYSTLIKNNTLYSKLNKNYITITSKFNENMWCDKELEDKRKLRYHKEVVNPNLEDSKYRLVLRSAKKKINIVKIRRN